MGPYELWMLLCGWHGLSQRKWTGYWWTCLPLLVPAISTTWKEVFKGKASPPSPGIFIKCLWDAAFSQTWLLSLPLLLNRPSGLVSRKQNRGPICNVKISWMLPLLIDLLWGTSEIRALRWSADRGWTNREERTDTKLDLVELRDYQTVCTWGKDLVLFSYISLFF